MIGKLQKAKEALQYIEFCTHMSCDTFMGKTCDENTKRAYEEQLQAIGCHAKDITVILDSIITELDSGQLVEKVSSAIQQEIDRHDNWGVTPYPMLAKAAITAMKESV